MSFNIETNTTCKLNCSDFSGSINPLLADVYALEKSKESDGPYMERLHSLHEAIDAFVQNAFDAGRRFEAKNK